MPTSGRANDRVSQWRSPALIKGTDLFVWRGLAFSVLSRRFALAGVGRAGVATPSGRRGRAAGAGASRRISGEPPSAGPAHSSNLTASRMGAANMANIQVCVLMACAAVFGGCADSPVPYDSSDARYYVDVTMGRLFYDDGPITFRREMSDIKGTDLFICRGVPLAGMSPACRRHREWCCRVARTISSSAGTIAARCPSSGTVRVQPDPDGVVPVQVQPAPGVGADSGRSGRTPPPSRKAPRQ